MTNCSKSPRAKAKTAPLRLLKRLLSALVPVALTGLAWSKPIHLRMVVWDGNDGLPVLRSVIKDFERVHPNIEVTLENVDFSTYFQKLLAEYAADVAPDVAMLDAGSFQAFSRRGALLPLSQFFGVTPRFEVTDYYKSAIDSYTYNGQLYVLPRDVAPTGIIFYNKRAFDEAGLKYPDGSWTWDFKVRPELREKDFFWVVKQLTKRDAKGRVTRWGFTPAWPSLWVDTMMFTMGARYADNPQHPTRVMLDDPRIVRAYAYMADLSLKQNWIPSQTQLSSEMQSTALQLFDSEKVAMYQSGSWDFGGVRTNNKVGSKDFFDWDIVETPAYAHGVQAAGAGGSGYSMLSSTQHPKESWMLIQWMAGEPAMTAMAKAGNAMPAIRKLALGPLWMPSANTPIDQQHPKNRMATDAAVRYTVPSPTADYWNEVNDIMKPNLDPIFDGSGTAAVQLHKAQVAEQRRLDEILNERALPKFPWPAAVTFGVGLVLALAFWVLVPGWKKLTAAEKSENRAGYWFIAPGLVGILLFSLGPMILSLLMSFSSWDIITPAGWYGVGNYHQAFFSDSRFWKSLSVTAIYTVFSVPAGVVVALALAVLLNLKVRGMKVYRTCFYLPALASTVATSLIWRKVFQQSGGLLNTLIYGTDGHHNFLWIGTLMQHLTGKPGPPDWLGNSQLALPSLCLMSLWGAGGGMIILLAGLQGVPDFYYEAALLDGANSWKRFRNVTLPLIAPSLFFVTVTGVIGSFQVFTQAFVMTSGGPNDSTRFFMLHLYEEAFRNLRMGYASALAWVLFVVIFLVTMLQMRLNKRIYYETNLR